MIEHDGCESCKYVNNNVNSYPCSDCCGNYIDKYEYSVDASIESKLAKMDELVREMKDLIYKINEK